MSTPKKVLSLDDITNNLSYKFKLNDFYIFQDLDENKICIINDNADIFEERLKYYDKRVLKKLLKTILFNMFKKGLVDKEVLSGEGLGFIENAIQGVSKTFNRNKSVLYENNNFINCFNMFKKTDIHNYVPATKLSFDELYTTIQEKYPRFFILLKNNIGKKEEIRWFLNWISIEINNPSISKTSPVLIGEQGSGKSLLMDTIATTVYDKSNVSVVDNKTIKDNFNDIYNYKAFVVMNEISTMDLKENNQITQDLKRLITDGTYINRGMFRSGIERTITFNIAFTTNKNVPLQIENGDRRFSIFGRAQKLILIDDFINFGESLNVFTTKAIEEIKKALLDIKSLDYNEDVAVYPLDNEFKRQIINQSNSKEDLLKSIFNQKDFNSLKSLLKQNGCEEDDYFYFKLEKMFLYGIFSNDILSTIYKIIFSELEENESKVKVKSGRFFSKILKNPAQSVVYVNNSTLNVKVIDEVDIERKKEKLKFLLEESKYIVNNYNGQKEIRYTSPFPEDGHEF